MEVPIISSQQKIQDTGFRWESHADHFWDVNGPILKHFQEKGQTVTSAQYSDMLANELKPVIRLKRQGLLSKGVLLLHNAHPHKAAHTMDTLRVLKFEVLKHPPYSPDLVPSDFHLFGPMKEHLQDQKFEDDEVMEAVQSWLKATPKSFFLRGHPLACGQVDQVCCEAGGLCRKIRHKHFYKFSCKNFFIKFLLLNDLPLYYRLNSSSYF